MRAEYVSVIMPGETRWFQVDIWRNESFWAWANLEGSPGTEVAGDFEVVIVDPSGERVETAPSGVAGVSPCQDPSPP